MTYTYTSPKKVTITATLEQNKMSVTTQNKNEESIVDIYQYTDILEINLSFVSRNHYATKIDFRNSEPINLRNLSVLKGSYDNQSDQYFDWVLLLHDNLKDNNLNEKIEFTQGNSNNYSLLVTFGIIGVLVSIVLLYFKLYLNVAILLIPSLGSIYMAYRIGTTKPYNPNEIPGNYLP